MQQDTLRWTMSQRGEYWQNYKYPACHTVTLHQKTTKLSACHAQVGTPVLKQWLGDAPPPCPARGPCVDPGYQAQDAGCTVLNIPGSCPLDYRWGSSIFTAHRWTMVGTDVPTMVQQWGDPFQSPFCIHSTFSDNHWTIFFSTLVPVTNNRYHTADVRDSNLPPTPQPNPAVITAIRLLQQDQQQHNHDHHSYPPHQQQQQQQQHPARQGEGEGGTPVDSSPRSPGDLPNRNPCVVIWLGMNCRCVGAPPLFLNPSALF